MATIRTTLVVVLLGLGIGVGFHSPFLIVEDGHFGKGNANDNFSQKIFFFCFVWKFFQVYYVLQFKKG